jgi:hypothetical protein
VSQVSKAGVAIAQIIYLSGGEGWKLESDL